MQMKKIKILLTLLVFITLTVEASINSHTAFFETKITFQTKTGEVSLTLTTTEPLYKLIITKKEQKLI